MADDIVTSLKFLKGCNQPSHDDIASAAANEITRLRAELDAEGNEANLLMLEIKRLRTAGDALAVAYRTVGGLEVAHDAPLRAWEEARRG